MLKKFDSALDITEGFGCNCRRSLIVLREHYINEKKKQREIVDKWFEKAEHYEISDNIKYELLEMLDLPREDWDFKDDRNMYRSE
jgi:hypothetical protein